jgi:hypothetical protein
VRELPAWTVTFLFTDVEGSTRWLHELGDRYAEVLAEHRCALRDAFARHGGVEVDTRRDAFFVAFGKASDGLAAATDARAALEDGPIRVRIGLHTGEPLVTEEGYVGIDVHRAARIASAGHGGQILVSQSTRDLAGADSLRELGEHRLKDLTAPERLYQLGEAELPRLKTLYQTNLPIPATPFLGRERELAAVEAPLAREDVRLLTLAGPAAAERPASRGRPPQPPPTTIRPACGGCRSRSNWRLRVPQCSRRLSSTSGLDSGSTFCAADVTPMSGSRRSAPQSSGRTSCLTRGTSSSFAISRFSPAVARLRPQRRPTTPRVPEAEKSST